LLILASIEKMEKIEKRKHTRVRLVSLVDYSGTTKAKSKDISENGICIISDRVFSSGTPLLLAIPLNSKGVVRAIAKAVWNKECSPSYYENGLEFSSISKHDRQKIATYIDETMKDKSERRMSQRKRAEIVINYSIKAEAVTKNVTRQGMCLVTRNELQVGKIVYVVITLSGGKPMNIYGKVIWSKETKPGVFENGIEYWEIKNEDEEKLLDYFNDQSA
jgi:c-di-GMP-binding flagellar brake protein YcgR